MAWSIWVLAGSDAKAFRAARRCSSLSMRRHGHRNTLLAMWFFNLEALLGLVVAGLARHWRAGTVLGTMSAAVAGLILLGVGQVGLWLRDLAFSLGLAERTAMIEHGVGVKGRGFFKTESGAYFFLRVTGFSPDPYCGYE